MGKAAKADPLCLATLALRRDLAASALSYRRSAQRKLPKLLVDSQDDFQRAMSLSNGIASVCSVLFSSTPENYATPQQPRARAQGSPWAELLP